MQTSIPRIERSELAGRWIPHSVTCNSTRVALGLGFLGFRVSGFSVFTV